MYTGCIRDLVAYESLYSGWNIEQWTLCKVPSDHNTGIAELCAQSLLLNMDNRDYGKPPVKARIWNAVSNAEKKKLKLLSAQYKANKAAPANRTSRHAKGVSLEMLAQSSLLGADTEDENCSKWVTDMVETQADVVAFVQTLPALRDRVIQCHEQLAAAAQAGHMSAFGEQNTQQLLDLFSGLVQGLDVYAVCPYLAAVHQAPDHA
jgi:hypothetical protein